MGESVPPTATASQASGLGCRVSNDSPARLVGSPAPSSPFWVAGSDKTFRGAFSWRRCCRGCRRGRKHGGAVRPLRRVRPRSRGGTGVHMTAPPAPSGPARPRNGARPLLGPVPRNLAAAVGPASLLRRAGHRSPSGRRSAGPWPGRPQGYPGEGGGQRWPRAAGG